MHCSSPAGCGPAILPLTAKPASGDMVDHAVTIDICLTGKPLGLATRAASD